MKQFLVNVLIFFIFCVPHALSQDDSRVKLLKSNEYSDPRSLPPHSAYAPGFPQDIPDNELPGKFMNPPDGYGEVPFWWWSGDPLDKDRLLWQIEELHKKGINGMQINYIHKDSPGWPTYPAEPEIFSGEWWKMWEFAADEAGKRSMGIGMSGYTIDWPKSNNLFNRIIYSVKEIQGQELIADTIFRMQKGKTITMSVPDNTLEIRAYNYTGNQMIAGGRSLLDHVSGRNFSYTATEDCEIWIYTVVRRPGTINPVHPLSGKTVIDKFFQQFEDHSPGKSSEGLNYFFQDELKFGVGDLVWCDDFREEFRKSKGYDVFETLPGMFRDIGPLTAKSRLDYMDVKVRLSEERYFKPIFEWHYTRGKIYGCDPEGRGREPGAYGDNFRAQRWYTAPGHDTPSGRADLIKGKVSSSIAALYKRPRVWLEGYHSLGWGATPDQIMYATLENYLYGCNLLNLHGLYYSTHGSFWEWAPPCYHFRMPYWEHMAVFLKYFERLSFLLSQGTLRSDIAIVYPVSTAQAKINEKEATSSAFSAGTQLFNNGYDFTFIDDQSLVRAEVNDRKLKVSGLEFSVLILPDLKAIRWSTLCRALDFYRAGGNVIALGSLPETSDHYGKNDPDLIAVIKEIFGENPGEDMQNGKGIFIKDANRVLNVVSGLLPKQVVSNDNVRFMHRKIGARDVFMVMGAKPESDVLFRAGGIPERWDPLTGVAMELSFEKRNEAISVKMPSDSSQAYVIVFTPGEKKGSASYLSEKPSLPPLSLDGNWEFLLKPVMNNQWGDFRLPVTEKIIGAEARIFRYKEERAAAEKLKAPSLDDSDWEKVTYGFGQKFWKLGPLPEKLNTDETDMNLSQLKSIDPKEPVRINGRSYFWQPYSYSWRMGKEGDPGHQGYHGLKEEVTNDFICLGKPVSGLNETLYKEETEGSLYYLWTSAIAKNVTNVTIQAGGNKPTAVFIDGKKEKNNGTQVEAGSNPVLLRYDKPGRGHFVMVTGDSVIMERTPLSMKWWDMPGLLQFDVRPEQKNPAAWYRFTAPPGLKGMNIRVHGKPVVYVEGQKQEILTTGTGEYSVGLKKAIPSSSVVAIRVEQERGYYGGAAFPEPVLLECAEGISHTGSWADGSVLDNYSGGAFYRKNFTLTPEQAASEVWINLGKVIATAEIRINGKAAATLVSSPWKVDITGLIRSGENSIEVLVYNTLANHYLTIPTKYRGSLESGLIGPVRLEFSKKN
jgi:hypothetical protein